jgi:hypothetical protein
MVRATGSGTPTKGSPAEERWVSLAAGSTKIPERLLLAHSRGQVLFITGAGTSRPSGLPDFRQLVIDAYQHLDAATHLVLTAPPLPSGTPRAATGLSNKQDAEVARSDRGDYDVVLGMLERRIDGASTAPGKVRQRIAQQLRTVPGPSGSAVRARASPMHRALIRLADRGAATTIATTNFDRLLQAASSRRTPTYALGGIPRPGRRADFAGVLHIHGALSSDVSQPSDFVVTDRDFGEFYLRRRVVPDFVYDAARLFNLVLVGYSANDAPMRYLLNAVAADGSRFDDLKERFAFVPTPSSSDLSLEDWQGRGITPIPYDPSSGHSELETTLQRWSELSPINGDQRKVDALVKRLVRAPRASTGEPERDLFDHLVRRSSPTERLRFAALASRAGASFDWLDAIAEVALESDREPI